MNLRSICLAVLAVGIFVACSAKQPEKVKPGEQSNTVRSSARGVSIVQVEKFFNRTSNQAYAHLLDALKKRNIPIAGTNENRGQVQTNWVTVQDHLCENGIKSNTPVTCRARFHFDIAPLSDRASSLRGRYQELCNFNEEILVECPNSNAEGLLKAISEEVATAQ